MEIWKDVVGYEGYYQVSDAGRVKSVERRVDNGCGGTRLVRERIKTTGLTTDGYIQVGLSKDGYTIKQRVHRLVYEAFVGEIPEGMDVNHIDFDRTNNRLENLELLSHGDNVRYSIDAGRHYVVANDLHGENNPNFGNHKLSQIYAENPEMSKEKQGRPGLQNGRCREIIAYYPGGEVKKYDYIAQCVKDMKERGYTNATDATVYAGIWKSIKEDKSYRRVNFEYAS